MELESLRRDLIANEKGGRGRLKYDPATGERGGASTGVADAAVTGGGSNATGKKLAPGPFAGISKSGAGASAPSPASYTAPVPEAVDALQQRSRSQQQETQQHESEQLQHQRRPGDSGQKATLDDDHADVIAAAYTTDGYKLATPRRPGKSPPPPPQLSSSGACVGEGEGIGETNEDYDEFVPTGGYPKRLASAMSFCRVSNKATCEVLIALGRVTVNGVPASDPMMKVDVVADTVVCNGEWRHGGWGSRLGHHKPMSNYLYASIRRGSGGERYKGSFGST